MSHPPKGAGEYVIRRFPTYPHLRRPVGAAEAGFYYEKIPQALEQARQAPMGASLSHYRDEVAYVSGGMG